MAHATITRTLTLLRTSVHGQLLVLAAGAVAVAVALLALAASHAIVASQLLVLLLVGLSARSAARGIAGYDTAPADVPGDLLQVAPRLLAQAAGIMVPAAIAWWLALQLAGAAPVLGLVVLLVLVPASLLLPAPLLLTAAAVGCGDRAWVPDAAITLARRRPGMLAVHAFVLAGLVVAALCAVPVALLALAVGAQLGSAAPAAFAVAVVAPTPLLGCGSVALWKVLDGDSLLRARLDGRDEVEVEPPAAPAGPRGSMPLAPPVPAGAGSVEAASEAWADGPTWDVAIDAGAVWGTWIRLPAAVRVGVRITWHGGEPPALSIASPDGTWRQPGDPTASGTPVVVDLPLGDSYVQLTCRASAAQALSITLLLPARAAA